MGGSCAFSCSVGEGGDITGWFFFFPPSQYRLYPSSNQQVHKRYLRRRNEFIRGSAGLVELELRYCFLFSSVNPNELSLLSIGKGKTKQKPSAAKAKRSYCQNETPKIVRVIGITREIAFI